MPANTDRRDHTAWMRGCIPALAVSVVALLCGLIAVPRANAQQQSDAVIRLSGGTVAPGESTTTTLTVDLAQRPWVHGLELGLTFDPAAARLESIELAPGWRFASGEPPAPVDGAVGAAIEATDQACIHTAGCLVATIEWTGLAPGDAHVAVDDLRLIGASAGEAPPIAVVEPLAVDVNGGAEGDGSIGGAATIVLGFAVLTALGALGIALLARLGLVLRGLRRRPLARPARASLTPGAVAIDASTAASVEAYFAVIESLADAEYSETRDELVLAPDDEPGPTDARTTGPA